MLQSLFADISRTDTRFIVYAPAESAIPSWLTTHNVAVTHEPLPQDGPDPFLAIESAGTFSGALTLAHLDDLLTPPVVRPGETEVASEGYQILFDVLHESIFTALHRDQLLTVSREIEDRAYRVGTGTLRVCFQTFSTFKSQLPVYRHLATQTDLDIHIYAVADWEPPAIPGITYYDISGTDLELYWLLAFDGGSESSDACALIARDEGETYTGYWTDDRELLDRIDAELRTTAGDSTAVGD